MRSTPSSAPDPGQTALKRHLITPRAGEGVCPHCFDLTGPRGCRSCAAHSQHLTALLPISYSVGGESLHRQISAYKRRADPSVPAAQRLMSDLLSIFLAGHERCLASASGVDGFDLVTAVPSGSGFAARDQHHPLHAIVAALPAATHRYERLLAPGRLTHADRRFDPDRYTVRRRLSGQNILLIDDMWTTGASAQSAAAALRAAGAGSVAAVVVARHLNRGWADNDLRLRRLQGNFSWAVCALCADGAPEGKKRGPVSFR